MCSLKVKQTYKNIFSFGEKEMKIKKIAVVLSVLFLASQFVFGDAKLNKEIAQLELELVKIDTRAGIYEDMSEEDLEKARKKTKKELDKKREKAKKEAAKNWDKTKQDLKESGKEIEEATRDARKDIGEAAKEVGNGFKDLGKGIGKAFKDIFSDSEDDDDDDSDNRI